MLGVALVAALLAGAQQPLAFAGEHGRCVRTERMTALQEALARVDASRRSAACDQLIALRPPGAGLVFGPRLESLAQLTRELEGQPWTESQSLADSLDLALAPGAFEAREAGPGEALTVRVQSLWGAERAPEFVLTLYWVAPSGERSVARREPVSRGILARGGFEMYLRPPASGAGTWQLEPCVESGGESACGVPIRVACVSDLGARMRALDSAGEASGVTATAAAAATQGHLLRALTRLQQRGVRAGVALGAAELLELAEGRAPPGGPRPLLRAYVDRDGLERWVWSLRPAGELERTVCLLLSGDETVDALFAGPLGAAWSAFAEREHALLLATHLPQRRAEGDARELLLSLRAEARSRVGEDTPLTVVARAESAGRLQLGLHGSATYPFDELVISAVVASPEAATIFPGLPRLLLSPGAVPDPEAGLFVAPGARLPLFNDLELPALVGAWLAR